MAIPKLNIKWKCDLCGRDETSRNVYDGGKIGCRVVFVAGSELDGVVCKLCDVGEEDHALIDRVVIAKIRSRSA